MRSLLLTLFSLVCFLGTAQIDSYQDDIIKYLNVNGTQEQYSHAYEEMFDVLKVNFETANVPDKVWEELKADKAESLEEVTKFLTFAYRKHFTQPEIKAMTKFYESNAAQKMLNQNSEAITESENLIIETYLKSDIALKVENKLPELSQDISEISAHWSRDLFGAKMSALVKLGYKTKF